MQSSGKRPPDLPDIESLRELLARLERCEQILPSAQQASGPTPPAGTSAAAPAEKGDHPRARFSNGTLAASFAVGFAFALTAVTLAIRPGTVDFARSAAVAFADGGSSPAEHTARAVTPPAKASVMALDSGNVQAARSSGRASAVSRVPVGGDVAPSKVEARVGVPARPKLSVAGRLEAEVGGTVPLAVALSDAPRAEADVAMLVRGVPDDVALSPAWPMGSGVWFVNPVDAGKLRLTLYGAPRQDSQLSIELWSPDGSLIATANALLVAPSRASETLEVVAVAPKSVEAPPPTRAATVVASRPEPTALVVPAAVERLGAVEPMAPPPRPTVGPRRSNATAHHKSRRRAARRSVARAEPRAATQTPRNAGASVGAQSRLVWPGDAPNRSATRRAPARSQPAPAVNARPTISPNVVRSRSPSSWPAVAFGQTRGP